MNITLNPTQGWYSWHGANQDIFNLIYGKGMGLLQPYFYILEFVGDHKNIYYLAFLIALMVGGNLLYRKLSGNKIDGYYIRSQVAWILSCALGFLATAAIVGFLKEYAAFPRPYAAFPNAVKLLYGIADETDVNRSFPSGHAAMAAFLMVALWSRMIGLLRFGLLVLMITMCWYRVVTGYHFPADVAYGALIGMVATGMARNFMCKIFRVWR
jgi:membrane-associated phospholipid phosphatase